MRNEQPTASRGEEKEEEEEKTVRKERNNDCRESANTKDEAQQDQS